MTDSPSEPLAAEAPSRRALGAHPVSAVGLGAMQLPRLRDEPGAAVALLRRAVELGVDHVDTAQFYGDGLANAYLAEALRPDDGMTIVSKVGAAPQRGPIPMRAAQRPEELRAEVHANLRSLGLERIPVVNLRRIDAGGRFAVPRDQVVDFDDQLAEMVALRKEGLIGAIGVSTVTLDQLNRALPVGIVCVQNPYSLASRDDEELLDVCTQHDIAWVPYFPLGGAWPGAVKVTSLPAVQDVA
ncbi:MAG: aldo/keto reductase, partial [Dermatophilaceae bacterium]